MKFDSVHDLIDSIDVLGMVTTFRRQAHCIDTSIEIAKHVYAPPCIHGI